MRRRTLALAFTAALLGSAGTLAAQQPLFTTRGAFFAASVPDLDAATRWYVEKLGLKVVMAPQRHERTTVTALEGGGLIVELLQHDGAVAATATTHGIFKAGMVVEDFDGVVQALRARGVEIVAGPFPAREGMRANVIIRDVAGNLLQVFGALPGGR